MSHNVSHPAPAHKTKHLPVLAYRFRHSLFHLAQLDNGNTNGTALWMGAQVLSAWLSRLPNNKFRAAQAVPSRRPRVLELGSGIGLSALALSALGWDVLSTDLPDVIDSVLAENISNNINDLPPDSGTIEVRALDWTSPPSEWTWADSAIIASTSRPTAPLTASQPCSLDPPFGLIVTADTVYSPHLVQPLIRTLEHLYSLSTTFSDTGKALKPSIYVCIERRDPSLVDTFLTKAREAFTVSRIPPRKVIDAMEREGLSWPKEDREGMEIWSLQCAGAHSVNEVRLVQ